MIEELDRPSMILDDFVDSLSHSLAYCQLVLVGNWYASWLFFLENVFKAINPFNFYDLNVFFLDLFDGFESSK